MINLRIVSINVINSTTIVAKFTEVLNENINTGNVVLTSQTPDVTDPQVLKVDVVQDTLNITVQPLIPLAAYFITFMSAGTIKFTSINADAIILQNGIANQQLIFGPIEDNNAVKQNLTNYLRDTIYASDPGTVIGSYVDVISTLLSKALNDIHQVGNENYISFKVEDELQTRSSGPFDRLAQEGAYEILKVSKFKNGTMFPFTFTYNTFPVDPVSLQQKNQNDILTISSVDGSLLFNLNTFTLNLSKQPVIKLDSVTFTYSNGHAPYTYDIPTHGYQITDSRFDTQFGFTYLLLNNNQIRLSDKILEDPNFSTTSIFQILVNYDYKDLGRIPDTTTVDANILLSSGREVLPPLENIFTFKHAPIVDNSGNIPKTNGISFINMNVLTQFNSSHPAFLYEVPYSLQYLPSRPGEYSIDYSTGTAYVYGADSKKDGTGPTPSVAVYKYKFEFKNQVDYVYDEDFMEFVALPNGSLINNSANLTFKAEQTLTQNIDFVEKIHQESLNERINNNLLALNALTTKNSPITNVFRVFNETSGEIYTPIRWYNNKVYFSYNKAPNLQEEIGERASFQNVLNEILFINTTLTTLNPLINIFKILLMNNNIMAATEDCLGSFFNTSATFSDLNIFAHEVYFDPSLTEANNLLRIASYDGYYMINYANGIVYCAVPSTQDSNIGSISYKRGYVETKQDHITSVEDIYYRFSSILPKEKTFSYTSFNDTTILPSSFDLANEYLLGNDPLYPYLISGNLIGTFANASFVAGVSQYVKSIRSIYEKTDLLNDIQPINFAPSSTFNGKVVTVSPLVYNEYHTVQYNITDGYYVLLNTSLLYKSSNITITASAIRTLDSAQLWNGNLANFVIGNPIKLILSSNSPHVGNFVYVTYSYTINNLSSVVIDYNKGDYYVDYTYLADEILISYEYGDNVLDFSQSLALATNDQYYVTYKAGALRDALQKNFGSLIDIPLLTNLSVDFDRERYRDALMAAMQSFINGPTLTSIKNIAEIISHTPPEIIESSLVNWSLGNSLLNQEEFITTGSFSLLPAKYGSGALINAQDQTIKLPISSNLRLEDGSLECWIKPQWDGLDNQSDLMINITKDGYLFPASSIYVGPSEYHPTYILDSITNQYNIDINKNNNVTGVPNKNKNGVYVYYNNDPSGLFDRWFVEVIDGYDDGYALKSYSIKIKTNGKFYDTKILNTSKPTQKIFTGTNNLTYIIQNNPGIDDGYGFTFIADNQHYLFDYGNNSNQDRISLFKDESGYFNFRTIDHNGMTSVISYDISKWMANELHYVSAAWKINTKAKQDEIHLFIDGFEVPNIIRYGNRIGPYLHEKFRTIDPEEIVGVIAKPIVASTDLSTTAGSNVVASSINFASYGIVIGNTIYIEEPGFSTAGYTITNVAAGQLTLNTSMPLTAQNLNFSVNKTSFHVQTEISIYPNIVVDLLHTLVSGAINGADLTVTSGSNVVTASSSNFITAGVKPGYIIRITTATTPALPIDGYTILSVSSTSLVLDGYMPVSVTPNTNLSYLIYPNTPIEIPGVRALKPAYEISQDANYNYILTIRDLALANDIVLIETLGLNHRRIKQKYYLWGNKINYSNLIDGYADGYGSNLIKTKLPTPISLGNVDIYKILLPLINIGPSNSSIAGGIFQSNNITSADGYVSQPSNIYSGRILEATITTTANTDLTYPVSLTIDGYTINQSNGAIIHTSEVLTFNLSSQPQIQTLTKDTVNLFILVNFVQINCKPISTTKNCLVLSIGEKNIITVPDFNLGYATYDGYIHHPIIRFSYQVYTGSTLDGYGAGFTATDPNAFFSDALVGHYLHILPPSTASGFYYISNVEPDHKTLDLTQLSTIYPLPVANFTNASYEIFDVSTYRSGLQNGFFTFESVIDGYDGYAGQPYVLTPGWYDFDYYTYLAIPFEIHNPYFYVGSDINGANQINAIIDQFKISSIKLTDTRIGETVPSSQETITKNFNSLKALKKNQNTLVLTTFNSFPFINGTDFYITADKNYIQSGSSINDNFNQSICITDNYLTVDNTGILTTKTEGTIEFWINPIYDTHNDPQFRYYFDASSIVSEKLVSTSNDSVVILGTTSNVLSVKLQVGDNSVDYFAGGSISSDNKTIILNRRLPSQNTPVIVTYIPSGTSGDRISIYKDNLGSIIFEIIASGEVYQIQSPVFWTRNSWHRVKASFKMNKGIGSDEIRLFIDGYERGNITWNSGILLGQNLYLGSAFIGPNMISASIKFNDTINLFNIGADFMGNNPAYALFDNVRFSNISRPLYQPFGESLDPSYNSNLNVVFPVVEDLYTTLLLDFDTLITKTTDFATIRNSNVGLFDFTVNVFDSYDIVSTNSTVKAILIALLNTLKPANSRVFINVLTQ